MTTTLMQRWEYAFLEYEFRAKKSPSDDSWTFTWTAVLSMRARRIARWRNVRQAKGNQSELEIPYQVSWHPVGTPAGEHNRVVQGPVDHLGDLGWELVSTNVTSSAVRPADELGSQTTASVPVALNYLFKRPQRGPASHA